ncbi:MAG: AAA family ATPase [Anaerolineae bacterium]|nr:AAA family ATPase [Anaerolineae bacterium]
MKTVHPSLIIVTGRPGSGKSVLAHKLALSVRCPLISRDEIKEGLIHTVGQGAIPERDITRHTYETFFSTVRFLLTERITLIAEAAFQHKVWAPQLEALQALAQIRIIVCQVDAPVAKARFLQRYETDPTRSQFHGDADGWAYDTYMPPDTAFPTLVVDTSDGYYPDFEAVVAFSSGSAGIRGSE